MLADRSDFGSDFPASHFAHVYVLIGEKCSDFPAVTEQCSGTDFSQQYQPLSLARVGAHFPTESGGDAPKRAPRRPSNQETDHAQQ